MQWLILVKEHRPWHRRWKAQLGSASRERQAGTSLPRQILSPRSAVTGAFEPSLSPPHPPSCGPVHVFYS